jgi:hypothetical protein
VSIAIRIDPEGNETDALTSRQEMISLDAERGVAMKLRTAVVVTLTGIVLLTGLYYVCRTTHRI